MKRGELKENGGKQQNEGNAGGSVGYIMSANRKYTLCLNSSQLGYDRCEKIIMECSNSSTVGC